MKLRSIYQQSLLSVAGLGIAILGVGAVIVGCQTSGQYGSSEALRPQQPQYRYAPGEARDAGRLHDPLAELREPHASTNHESYDNLADNPFVRVTDEPLSTFSLDVDTASYANVRRMLQSRQAPPAGAVRIEEFVNYFPYEPISVPAGETVGVQVDVADAPWRPQNRLVRVSVQGRDLHHERRPDANLVFLIDVSGSMSPANKLPLVKHSLRMLAGQLTPRDRVAIVVYAGSSGVVLPSTAVTSPRVIEDVLARLEAGGSTNGSAGIRDAYAIAARNYIRGGVNRVILCTDGDFNVGVTDRLQLVELIQEQARTGVFLSVLGFGTGNWQDATMEALSNEGNGNFAYIDSVREAEKVFGDELAGTLVTVAKDAKIQIEFNPLQVEGYRLIGYENRMLASEDFNDDRKDAGDIGAGHRVTAFYEVIPSGRFVPMASVEPMRYRHPTLPSAEARNGELLTVKLRYKLPEASHSRRIEVPVVDEGQIHETADDDFRFAAAVAAFGMILRDSPYRGDADCRLVKRLARDALAHDPGGYRKQFIELVEAAQDIDLPRR